jgi:NodT family efflux transporter outer membrane factor (OMF) lipoprotein
MFTVAVSITVSGCAVGPAYHPSQTATPAAWVGSVPEAATENAADMAHWWSAFHDPILESLVKQAVASNLDLKLAESRIRQARAARSAAVAGLGPAVSANSSFTRSRTSPGGSSVSKTYGATDGTLSSQYQAGFDASWELDIFGGVRRNVEAANADLQASIESRRDVLVTLAAETAVNYIDLRACQQQIVIARENLLAQQRTAELTRKLFKTGFYSALDTANADALTATTAAQIPVLETLARQYIYSLSLLIGREPGALMTELTPPSGIPAAAPSVPVGIPADLLRQRPDIRMAEAQIHAATARIGVATADLFPKFTLSGAAGFMNNDFTSWFDWVNRFWSFGPSASWQIFDTGKTRANIEQQKALEEQSVITYQQTVLTALQEVENALISSTQEYERRKALTDAVTANRKAVDLAIRLYSDGQTDFLNVLQSQRSLYTSEDALAQSNRNVSTNLVALYKAVGGGWEN